MKHLALAAGVCMLLAACTPPRPDFVENPDVLATNTTDLDVRSVELTDSTTVLSFDVTYIPGWWIRIAENSVIIADGDTLPLLGAEGIVPGERHTMPAEGKDSFKLTFGAIPPEARSLTFTEGAGGWTLSGICLMPGHSTLPDVPADVLRAADGPVYAGPVLEVADTRFNIHIAGYLPEVGRSVQVTVSGLGGQSFNDIIQLDARGIASFDAPVYGTSTLTVEIPSIVGDAHSILVAPGKETDIYIDPRYSYAEAAERLGFDLPARYIYDNGTYAALNAALATVDPDSYSISYDAFPGAWQWTAAQYADSLQSVYSAKSAAIADMAADAQLKEYLSAALDIDAIEAVVDARTNFVFSYYQAHHSLENLPAFDVDLKSDGFAARFVSSLNPDNHEMLAIPAYGPMTESLVSDSLGIEWPQATEVARYLVIYNAVGRVNVGEDAVQSLRELSDPFYADAVEARIDYTMKKMEELSDRIQSVPDVDDDELFDAIMERYRGRLVLVDLWNTWCGPCRRALAANEHLKTDEFADADIAWVYIADTSSDAATYLAMLPAIAGDHYRLEYEQMSAIRNKFNVDGIPYYILVDREGNATGHPDFRDHNLMVQTLKANL